VKRGVKADWVCRTFPLLLDKCHTFVIANLSTKKADIIVGQLIAMFPIVV
jgi:hypothetical protein